MWCDLLIFKESCSQLLITKQLISTCIFTFHNLSSCYVIGFQVVQSCTCKEYSKNIQFMATSHITIQPLVFLTTSHLTITKKTSTYHITNQYRLVLQLVLTMVIVIAMAMLITWAEVMARKISRTIKQLS